MATTAPQISRTPDNDKNSHWQSELKLTRQPILQHFAITGTSGGCQKVSRITVLYSKGQQQLQRQALILRQHT